MHRVLCDVMRPHPSNRAGCSDGAGRMPLSNFPLLYRLSRAPRSLRPSLGGGNEGFAPRAATMLDPWPRDTVRLAFLGDISAVANETAPVCDQALRDVLASADLIVGNCESPVVHRPLRPLRTQLGLVRAMDTAFLLGLLGEIGIDPERLVLSLANDHAFDQGAAGLDETIEALDHLGIGSIGADKGRGLQRVAVGGLTIGLIAFTHWRRAAADEVRARMTTTGEMRRLVEGIAGAADLICALPHWGWPFRHFPRDQTRALAARLAAKGVGLVAGHHAHVLQAIERIDGAVVAYGLGDFLGTAWTWETWPARIGGILVVDVSADRPSFGRIVGYELVPFVRLSDGMRERLTPVAALEGAMRTKVEKRLDAIYGPA